ncbi:LarC family nickel insertion protein [Paralcaligenes ureilyticus]|uniref:Nickel insertion protein n=1 Tax=Paralcaligenes ureilyticus TaxID=627131 RepID=A0A4R3LRP0_9BURK|nr:LarC family nickel insertion protein [Paralcaligenes ureilyticus]TCT02309.1 hypothetical protein EDC26_11935 [Paralcaligenes ureilyticus]
MPLHLHLDPVGGVAGDMFIAAVLDAFPQLADGMQAAIRSAGLPQNIACKLIEHKDHALTGRRFVVGEPDSHTHSGHHPTHEQAVAHEHGHISFATVRSNLTGSTLAEPVKRRAIAIFTLLAQAEAKVHGGTADQITFHEVGSWDSIADIVGAAYLIETLDKHDDSQGTSWSTAPLPLGSGRVKSAHGLLPVPAPATTLLMEGMLVRGDELEGERVTPTGAAILRHLNCSAGIGVHPKRLIASGTGFGTRSLPGISNVLRVLVFEKTEQTHEESRIDHVIALNFEVDDQSAEDLAVGLAHLREVEGVMDVLQIPAFGKKGRMVSHIQILVQPADRDKVIEACFTQTTTIGLRVQSLERQILPRKESAVTAGHYTQRVKTALRPAGIATAKAEMDDLASHANSHAEREALRVAAESIALDKEQSNE